MERVKMTHLKFTMVVLALLSLVSCGGGTGGAGTTTAGTFSLAWSEYPSWSVFGVAHSEGLIDKKEALLRVLPEHVESFLHPMVDPASKRDIVAKGLPGYGVIEFGGANRSTGTSGSDSQALAFCSTYFQIPKEPFDVSRRHRPRA